MEKQRFGKIKKFGFEFFSIFIGVIAAFSLDSWNENRKDENTEMKILTEINNGLKQDLKDIAINESGHKTGLQATGFFKQILTNKVVNNDSLMFHYFNLFRNFISVQNVSGYETLKSKGLEIIGNETLRGEIISLYENDYNSIRKLEEDYSELQFHENYFKEFNDILAPNFILDENGGMKGIKYPITISGKEKNVLLIDLWKIQINRAFMLGGYTETKQKIEKLQQHIEKELKR